MAIKKKEVFFGDNGANGPKVPILETAAPGLGTGNRAIKLGEQLLAQVHNRPLYALVLNDEDLDQRLFVFEEGGLDGVYRLGASLEAGGGRIIHVDGGAVEVQSSLTADLATDASNALFRANALSDTSNGCIGVDFVAKGYGTGAALYGYLDRRKLVFTTANTKLLATNNGILNPSGAGGDLLGMADTGASFWAQSGLSDIQPGVDLVEVLSGGQRGLYLIVQVMSAANVRLLRLSGVSPSFPSSTAVTFAVYRASLASAGGPASDRAGAGVTIAGIPGAITSDTAALTLVPGGRNGADSVPLQGSRYALRVRVLPANPGNERGRVGITARGNFLTESFTDLDAESRYAKELKGAGFRYLAPPSSGGPSIAFAALHQDIDNPSYQAILQARVEGGSIAGTFDGSGSVTVLQADLGDRFNPAPGTVVELFKTAGGTSLGVFRVKTLSVGDPNTYVGLQSIMKHGSYGSASDAYPYPPPPELENLAVTMQFLQGVVISSEGLIETIGGTMNVDIDTPSLGGPWQKSRATMFATTPYDRADADYLVPSNYLYGSTPAALHVANVAHDPRALLIRGVDRQEGDTFFVTARGQVSAKKGFYTEGRVKAAGYDFVAPVVEDVIVPLTALRTGFAGTLAEGWRQAAPNDHWNCSRRTDVGGVRQFLAIPISEIAPMGSTVSAIKITYVTNDSDYDNDSKYQLIVWSRPAMSRIPTNIYTGYLEKHIEPGATVTYTLPAGVVVTRGGITYGAFISNERSTDNIVGLWGVALTCSTPGLKP